MKSLFTAYALPLLLGMAALFGFYEMGHVSGTLAERTRNQAATDARLAQQAQAVALARRQAAEAGDAAVAQLRGQLQEAQDYHATLSERLRHADLTRAPRCVLTARPAPAAAGAAPDADGRADAAALAASASAPPTGERDDAPAAAAPVAPAAPPATPPAAPHDERPDAGQAGGTGLTLAAVSLWNSALVGADVPAGACRADAPGSEACLADAGITVADAWANHAANAKTCAEDRARLNSLVKLLCQRPEQQGCTR